jgi:hypothetical protein
MRDNGASGNASGLPADWRVEIGAAASCRRASTTLIELDAQTCAFERPGGPSFEMLAADVVIYEDRGPSRAGALAGNDNSAHAE